MRKISIQEFSRLHILKGNYEVWFSKSEFHLCSSVRRSIAYWNGLWWANSELKILWWKIIKTHPIDEWLLSLVMFLKTIFKNLSEMIDFSKSEQYSTYVLFSFKIFLQICQRLWNQMLLGSHGKLQQLKIQQWSTHQLAPLQTCFLIYQM